MNVNKLIATMNDRGAPLHLRTESAAVLWEINNRVNKNLKSFKSELITLAKDEQKDLGISSTDGKYITTVEKQPPTPKIDNMDSEVIKDSLGEEFYDQYIAHSHTIRWSEFRNAPPFVKEAFYSIPEIELTQTYQVKFKRT